MTANLALEVSAQMANLEPLLAQIDHFGQRQGWGDESLFQVRMVVEELVINVIDHGSQGGQTALVRLSLAQDGTQLAIELADTGVAYNPLMQPAPDLDASLEERAIGGLGVHLVRTLMDSVTYLREDPWNVLRLTKRTH